MARRMISKKSRKRNRQGPWAQKRKTKRGVRVEYRETGEEHGGVVGAFKRLRKKGNAGVKDRRVGDTGDCPCLFEKTSLPPL